MREPVPVLQAIEWYRWLGNWALVRLFVRRADGSMFHAYSIQAAVRRHDRSPA